MDIRALGPNPYTSKSEPAKYKYPYLLRGLEIKSPNQVWAADITYIGLRHGYLYLFAVIDLFSRYIIAWDLSNSMTAQWCKYVVESALEFYPGPEIFNTDQGVQFTADIFVKMIGGKRDKNEHGRKGKGHRQHLYRTVLAIPKI